MKIFWSLAFFRCVINAFGMIGQFKIFSAIIASDMPGNEFVLVIDTEPIWIGFQRQGLTGKFSRHAIVVGVQRDPELPGGSDLADSGDVVGM